MARPVGRRGFLAGVGALAALPAVARAGPSELFPHGVASGDPTLDGVRLWTRLGSAGSATWTVWADENRRVEVARGSAETAGPDHVVHVDVDRLAPGTRHWFAFEAAGATSPVGRTRTAGGDRVRLGVVSCSRASTGAFTAYRHLAAADVDAIVHLGDYLYLESRPPRVAHAEQRADPDLQALHAAHPLIAIWDDNDVANGAWRDGAPAVPAEAWRAQRAAAVEAFLDWLPVRADGERIWRRLPLGDLGDLLALDTRLWGRDRPASPDEPEPVDDPTRDLLGADQAAWVAEQLAGPSGPWTVLANQVMLGPLGLRAAALPVDPARFGFTVTSGGLAVNADQWDGYPAARDRLLAAVAAHRAGRTLVLTGDLHSSWVRDVATPNGPVAVEVVAPSVSAPSIAESFGALAGPAMGLYRAAHPGIAFADPSEHGYVVADLSADEARFTFHWVDPSGPDAPATEGPSFVVRAGEPVPVDAAVLAPPTTAAPAPRTVPAPPSAGGGSSSPWPVYGFAGATVAAAVGAVVALRRRR